MRRLTRNIRAVPVSHSRVLSQSDSFQVRVRHRCVVRAWKSETFHFQCSLVVSRMAFQIHEYPMIKRNRQWQAGQKAYHAGLHLVPLEWIQIAAIKNGSVDVVTEWRAKSEVFLGGDFVVSHVIIRSDIEKSEILDDWMAMGIDVGDFIEGVSKHDPTAKQICQLNWIGDEHHTPERCQNEDEHPLVHYRQHDAVDFVWKLVMPPVSFVVQTFGPPVVWVVFRDDMKQKVVDNIFIDCVDRESEQEPKDLSEQESMLRR